MYTLAVIPVVSQDPGWAGLSGLLPDVVRRHASFEDCEVFVSGPAAMTNAVRRSLRELRVPGSQVHAERFALAG